MSKYILIFVSVIGTILAIIVLQISGFVLPSKILSSQEQQIDASNNFKNYIKKLTFNTDKEIPAEKTLNYTCFDVVNISEIVRFKQHEFKQKKFDIKNYKTLSDDKNSQKIEDLDSKKQYLINRKNVSALSYIPIYTSQNLDKMVYDDSQNSFVSCLEIYPL